jgi:hypothetical protein
VRHFQVVDDEHVARSPPKRGVPIADARGQKTSRLFIEDLANASIKRLAK